MKNNFFKILLMLCLLLGASNTGVLSNEINFEAENIETVDENLIKASNNVYIYDNKGNKIYSDKLLINNKKIFIKFLRM